MKKKEVTEIIMEERGGILGTLFKDVPPASYFPEQDDMFILNLDDKTYKCNICQTDFSDICCLKEHIKISHKKRTQETI